MSIVKPFIKQITETGFPKNDKKQMAASGKYQGMARTLKEMGQKVHRINDIGIWGMEKDSSEKMPDFKKARFGIEDGIGKETRSLMEVLGLETKSDGQVGYSQTMVRDLESDFECRTSEKSVVKLTDKNLDDFNFTGPLAVSYGDPTGNGSYGAGPTRDLRRAYLLPRLVAIVPGTEIMKKNLLGVKTISPSILKLIENLETNYTMSYSGKGNQLTLEKDGEKLGVSILPINLFTEKTGLGKNCIGDLLITITAPNWTSGHAFLPAEVRDTSPLYGSLNYFLGNAVAGEAQLKAKAWIEGEIAKYIDIVNKVLPKGLKINQAGAVFIENS